jgi:hypothetical protein
MLKDKTNFPNMHIKAFTAVEVVAKIRNRAYRYLKELKNSVLIPCPAVARRYSIRKE